ncbi:MAG: tetratricopeptide repeat protein, partial [Dongiaceae bacterium]
ADTGTALAAYERGDFASAFDEFRILANDGDGEAMLWIGYLYQEGQGTTQDFGEAIRYYRMAADSGQPQAFYYIGTIYQDGLGVDEDPIEAVRWYRQAAERNDVYGQYALAEAYENGKGAPLDRRAARRWYQAAADQGNEEGAGETSGPGRSTFLKVRRTVSYLTYAQGASFLNGSDHSFDAQATRKGARNSSIVLLMYAPRIGSIVFE